ncbi:MAG TPA: choice-of-anchor Q domain-containing protein, partial [Clostridia bacterium]|nr:choice-of-anchor Q domain-containing protein [Clostridia bacterium]
MRYVLLCMVLLGTVPVLADYQVSNLADAGPGSLRQAILDANAAGGGRIDCQNISGSIVLEEPLPRFSANIQIEGPGAESLTISGSGKTTVFSMEAGTTNSVSGLTVAEGAAESLWQGEETVVPGRGAGIFNEGSLVLIACEVRDCIVLGERSAEGVGIYNTGDLVLRGCKVTRCGTLEPVPTVTRVYGGGIANRGSLQLVGSELDHCGGSHGGTVFNAGIMTAVQCAFSGGRALSPGHAGGILSLGDLILVSSTVSNCVGSWGGGVSSGGMFWATNSTFAGNYAEDYGGGLLLTGTNVLSGCSVVGNSSFWGGGVLNGGDTELINCTLSGNTGSQGAGVLNDWFLGNAKLHLNHCTVSFNRRDLEFFPGGGVDIKEGIGSAWNTLLAGNEGGDWVGVLESGGCNLVQDASQCSFTGNLTANLVGADPLLGPLGYHGGATPTHGFLSPSSPAIDAAGAGGLRTDQRGFARTCRSHPGGSPGADIGSYELARLEPVAAGWLDTGGEALGIELRGHLAFIANGPAGLLVCDVRDAANPQVLARVEP